PPMHFEAKWTVLRLWLARYGQWVGEFHPGPSPAREEDASAKASQETQRSVEEEGSPRRYALQFAYRRRDPRRRLFSHGRRRRHTGKINRQTSWVKEF